MSKATIIRKKALDLVHQQDWVGAIREYKRLVELDQSNPNVHNELADIYLKNNSKAEAYDSFVRAIDEYTRVGLYNNAVAVAKKVMRVLPGRAEVLTRLGNVRMKQGLTREAESYYLSFLDKAVADSMQVEAFKKLAVGIAAEMPDSVPVQQKLAECLLAFGLDADAGEVLINLHVTLEKSGDAEATAAVRAEIDRLGLSADLAAASAGGSPGDARTVVTEQNIWTQKHSAGERIDIESTPRFNPSGSRAAPAQPARPGPPSVAPPPPDASNGPSERDQYLLRLARGVGGGVAKPAAVTPAPGTPEAPAAREAPKGDVDDAPGAREEPPVTPATTATMPEPETGSQEGAAGKPAAAPVNPKKPSGDPTQISAMIGDDLDVGEANEDYRSHYDLGMAYMEMELLSEAIREFQVACKSPQFQVKCLEMIGLCFVRQSQPQLAIKQLTKGLALIGNDSEDALGIKYNLGLACEMVGDLDGARVQFEDVYVVDVTFRDVSEKLRKLNGSS